MSVQFEVSAGILIAEDSYLKSFTLLEIIQQCSSISLLKNWLENIQKHLEKRLQIIKEIKQQKQQSQVIFRKFKNNLICFFKKNEPIVQYHKWIKHYKDSKYKVIYYL